MKRLRVKYCYSEAELNDFLKPRPLELIHSIQYMPNMTGEGDDSKVSIDSSIIAVVQYFEV